MLETLVLARFFQEVPANQTARPYHILVVKAGTTALSYVREARLSRCTVARGLASISSGWAYPRGETW